MSGVEFSVSNDHARIAAQQAAETDAPAAQARQQHLHGEQRDERDDAAEQRNGGVL